MPEVTLHLEEAVERMGDKALYLEIAGYFVQLLPQTLAALTESMEAENWQEMRRLAHSLKSNCAALGAEALREEAYKLEMACAAGQGDEARRLFAEFAPLLGALKEKLQTLS